MSNQPREQDDAGVALDARTEVRRPPLFKVYLHNDDFTSMEFVVFVLKTIYHHEDASAFQDESDFTTPARGPIAEMAGKEKGRQILPTPGQTLTNRLWPAVIVPCVVLGPLLMSEQGSSTRSYKPSDHCSFTMAE